LFQKRLGSLVATVCLGTFLGGEFPLAAQDVAETSAQAAKGELTGIVRTARGVPIPGATVRVLHRASGNAWATWTEADALAKASRLSDGSVGQLATISSAEEQEFIKNAVLPPTNIGVNRNQVWLGGRQDDNQPPSAGWRWIVNPQIVPEGWDYENWTSPGAPDDRNGVNERFLTMWVHYYQTGGRDWRGTWNDENDSANPTDRIIGMIVEWCTPSVPASSRSPGRRSPGCSSPFAICLRSRSASTPACEPRGRGAISPIGTASTRTRARCNPRAFR